jgi:hypothetical protein
MSAAKWTEFLPVGFPLALAACGGNSKTDAQINAANQKANQAMTTARQALAETQPAGAKADRQFQQSLQKSCD